MILLLIPAGLLLALVLPGAAVTAALFPGRAIARVERLVLVPGLSLAVLVLGGLGMYACGVPLNRWSWAALTAGTTVVAAGIAVLRGARPRAVRITGRRLLPLALAAALLGTAGWVSVRSARAQSAATEVTALSMVGAGTDTDPRPVVVAIRGRGGFRLRITGPDGFRSTRDLTVDGGWTGTVLVPASGRVKAELFQAGQSTPCRVVYLDGASDLAGT